MSTESIPEKKSTFNLDTFKKVTNRMIATNESAFNSLGSEINRIALRKHYSIEEIQRIIDSGSTEEQVRLSRSYFYKDGFYRRLLIHYATLLKYAGLLIPNPSFNQNLSNAAIRKKYNDAVNFVERMSLPNFFTSCSLTALINGAYYGAIVVNDKKNFAILDLPPAYCRSRFKDMYGNDFVEFDVRYFYTISDKNKRKEALALYPKVISAAFRKFDGNRTHDSWVILPSDVGICFTFMDGCGPLFLSTIPATLEYDKAVDTELEKDADEIRKIIVQKVPHLSDGGLLFEPEEAEEMHVGAVGMMKGNKNVSVLTTYADVDAIVSKTSADSQSNSLEKMVKNIYYEAGASSELFAASGSSSLSYSVQNDTALMMVLANKYASFVTKIVNHLYANSTVSFKYTIFPISHYNEKEYIENTFKLASTGYSFLLPALACGLTQRDLDNVKSLENDVLKLQEKLIPLSSSYTQSAASARDQGGAPAKEDSEKKETTLAKEKSQEKTNQGGSN